MKKLLFSFSSLRSPAGGALQELRGSQCPSGTTFSNTRISTACTHNRPSRTTAEPTLCRIKSCAQLSTPTLPMFAAPFPAAVTATLLHLATPPPTSRHHKGPHRKDPSGRELSVVFRAVFDRNNQLANAIRARTSAMLIASTQRA